ncbi:Ig-like domain-containing protein [Rhabdobacter roseus]|uniref:SbsA Ig-like domain-containing protein n=1 Tax=Rhabdobacter roseus TaxID=1655419 RepID=A0A840U5J8_9BACT|nr:Ig-like domain-containing protein [Rhabdobacter roseus]MBB5287588.1 hypothetical protein [Rhabdobacter roseus]
MKKYWPLLLILLGFIRCAQQVAPTGGKKDSIPPQLLMTLPANKVLNYQGQSVELFFDEYVIVDNIQQKLIITPESENPYTFKQKGKSVLLNFKNKFNDSTTYTFNFGDAIRDFSERNPVQNLKLVFSTGPFIDSARIYGTIRDLKTNQPVFDALVGLYRINDTLNPEKQKPYYFSRTDSSGRYAIENIQSIPYRLIALDDKNRNQLYNPKDERIAFRDSAILAGTDSISYNLGVYLSDVTVPRVQRTIPKVNNYTVVFNKGLDSLNVGFLRGDTLPYMLEGGNQVKFFWTEQAPDTTLAFIVGKDSLGQIIEENQKIAFLPQRGRERQRDPFTLRTTPDRNQVLDRAVRYTFTFNKPVASLNETQIQLVNDSTSRQSLKDLTWRWNAYRNELYVEARATAKDSIKWDLPKGAIISVEGDTLPQALIKHPVLREDDFGVIRGSIKADSGVAFFIELVDKDFKPIQTQYRSPFTFNRIPPGEYYLRVTVDRNRNRRWDTGIFKTGQQPEPIYYYPSSIVVKSNFEFSDQDFTIPSQTTD